MIGSVADRYRVPCRGQRRGADPPPVPTARAASQFALDRMIRFGIPIIASFLQLMNDWLILSMFVTDIGIFVVLFNCMSCQSTSTLSEW